MKLSPCFSVYTVPTQAKPVYGGWLCLAPEGTDFDNPMQRSRVSPGRGDDNIDTRRATLRLFEDCFCFAEMAATLLYPVRGRQPELRPGRTGEETHTSPPDDNNNTNRNSNANSAMPAGIRQPSLGQMLCVEPQQMILA